MKKNFFKKALIVAGLCPIFFLMVGFAKAGENVDILFGDGFPILESNLLPGQTIKREVTVTNKTEFFQFVMIKFQKTSTPDLHKIEDKMLVSIKKTSDGSFLDLSPKTLSDFYDYEDGSGGVIFDILNRGVGSSEKYELIFTFDPNTGNDWQGKKTIFDLSVGIFARQIFLPVANDDKEETDQNEPVTIDILKNDTDMDGAIDPSTVVIISNPDHGDIISINPDNGKVKYDPDNDFVGEDEFTYTVKDNEGQTSNVARVKIDIIEEDGDPAPLSATRSFFQNLLSPLTEGEQEVTEVPAEGDAQTETMGDEKETEVAGAEACHGWPWWVWAIILGALVGGTTYRLRKKYQEKEFGWKVLLIVLIAGVAFWWYFDVCREYRWFPFGLVISLFVIGAYYWNLIKGNGVENKISE